MDETPNGTNHPKPADVGSLPIGVATEKAGLKLAEFLGFKYMLVEELAPILFILSMIGLIVWSFKMMRWHFGMGLMALIGGFLIVRIAFEVVVVAFSILGVLRQIRDRLPVKHESQPPTDQHEGQ